MKTDSELSERLHILVEAILEQDPLHVQFLQRAVAKLTQEERDRLESLLAFFERNGRSIEYICECYITIVQDTFAEQMYFMQHGRYRCGSYAEVSDHVYHNRTYMDKYMYGLIVTGFLWPNHVEIARFFRDNFPRDKKGRYLEVGPGHGYFMATAAAEGAFDTLIGVDISEASIQQTRAMLTHLAPQVAGRCDLRLCDFLAADALELASFDSIIMGEVLEHVEQPEAFLRRLHALARDDAYIYVTTCINAPAIDHIFLWRTTDELEKMIEANGFAVAKALRLPYEGKTLDEARDMKLPINVAYVLQKNAAFS